MKLGRCRNYHKGRAAIRHYADLREPSDTLRFKLYVILVFAEQVLVVVAVVAPAAGAVLVPLLVVGGVPVRVPPPVVAVPAVVVVRVRPPRVVRVTLGSRASNDSLQRFHNHREGPY